MWTAHWAARIKKMKNWFMNLSLKYKVLIHLLTIIVWFSIPVIKVSNKILDTILMVLWMLVFALEIVFIVFSVMSIFAKRESNKEVQIVPSCKKNGSENLLNIENKNIDFSNITEITFSNSANESQFLKFKKILPETVNKKFKPIASDTGVVSGAIEGASIKVISKNGLFSATVSPDDLMQYSDGSLGSIVKVDGKISEHAGFVPADAKVFAPMMVMKMLTMITSQYYLNGLNEQLKSIHNELNRLKNLDYSGDEGKLFSIQEEMLRKLNNRQPDEADFPMIDSCHKESLAIAGKYLSMLSKQKAPDKTDFHFSEKKRIDEIVNNMNESDGEYYMGIISTAYNLSLLADITYIRNLAYLNSKKDYTLRLRDFISSMESSLMEHKENYIAGSKTFFNDYEELIDKYRTKWSFKYSLNQDLDKRIDSYKGKWNETIYSIDKSPCIELKNKLIDYIQSPREVLICVNDDGKKQFLIEDSNNGEL